MPRFKLTEIHKDFIRSNYKSMSQKKMAKQLNIGVTPIITFMRNNALKVSKEQVKQFRIAGLTGRTTFTIQEDNFIKENYLKLPVKTIATKLNRSGCGVIGRMMRLNLTISKEIIEKRKKDSRFKKGIVPTNKGKKQIEYMTPEAIEKTKATRFKKGCKSHNSVPIGTVVKTKDGYLKEKIKEPNIWELKQRLVYSEYYSEELTPDDVICFVDGNKTNFTLGNLKKLSRAELMDKNTIHQYPKELKEVIKLNNKLIKQIKNLENGKK